MPATNISNCLRHGYHPRDEMYVKPTRAENLPGSDRDDYLSSIFISYRPLDLSFPYTYLNDDNSIITLWRSDANLRYTHIEEYLRNGTIPPWYLGSPIIDGAGISHGPLTKEAFIEMARQFYLHESGAVVESGSGRILQTSFNLLMNEFIALPSSIRDSKTLHPIQILHRIEQKNTVWFPDGYRRLRHYMSRHCDNLAQPMDELMRYRKRLHALARLFRLQDD